MKLKDGYKKLIGTSYNGDISQVLLSNGGNLGYAISSTVNTLVQRNANGQIESSLTDKAPFKISSTILNTNLNAELLGGYYVNQLFEDLSNDSNQISITIGGTNKKITIDYSQHSSNLVGGNSGNIIYQSSANTTAFLESPEYDFVLRYDTENGKPYWGIDSDTKVTQTITTTNDSYRVLFSATADDTTRTETARKATNLLFNPSSGLLTAGGFVKSGYDDTYVLLAGGGHKALSEFGGISGNYVLKTGDTMTGNLQFVGGDNGRFIVIDKASASICHYATTTSGWAMGSYIKDNAGNSLGAIVGAYGTTNTLTYYYYGGNWDNPSLVILPNKNVGIGSTNPGQKLVVEGAGIFRNTKTTTFVSDGITIGAGDTAERYITCYGKTGTSYINLGYGTGNNNCGELSFNYVNSASTENSIRLGLYGGANLVSIYPGNTTFIKPLIIPGELYGGNYGINMQNSDIVGINALYTSDNAEGGNEGLQFSRGNGYYDSVWASGGVLYFSPNGNLNRAGSYSNNYTVWHTGNLSMGLITITKSIRVTTSWQNTGIYCSDIGTGAFVVMIENVNDWNNGGSHYNEYYVGLMASWASGSNSGEIDDILLHRCGHAPNSSVIYLRTARVGGNASSPLLQIAGNYNMNSAQNITFKFRRII